METCSGLLRNFNGENRRKKRKLKEEKRNDLRCMYEKYASMYVDGTKCMRDADFLVNYLQWLPDTEQNKKLIGLLSNLLGNKQVVTLEEFERLERDFASPDNVYKIAFKILTQTNENTISQNGFLAFLHKSGQRYPPGDDFLHLYFGQHSKNVGFSEFPQFLKDLSSSCAKEAFKQCDKEESGYITTEDFIKLIIDLNSTLPEPVKERIRELSCNCKMLGNQEGEDFNLHQVSFGYFMAFNRVLNNMETIKLVYLTESAGDREAEVSKEDFLRRSQVTMSLTPLEVDILFRLTSLFHEKGLSGPWRGSLPLDWRVAEDVEIADHENMLTFADIKVISPKEKSMHYSNIKESLLDVQRLTNNHYHLIELLESFYRFTLGSIAGAIGATAVYPVDLVKTRMQNQRTSAYLSEAMYNNSWDCFKKVLNHEGFFGLYRGLLPQLVGVAPEKAMKLTTNDFVRGKLRDEKTGSLSLLSEVFAGGCGGASQVLFTNPLEIVKIRLQVAGEISSGARVSAVKIMHDLGLRGLYRGSAACFLRDIPFSAIFFPAYAHFKHLLADTSAQNSPLSLLAAGGLAGIPASLLVTPADVIKTRLQVKALHCQTSYIGIKDATTKIYREEGFRAFWKGSVARMCRSSPQFGATLFAYELLQRAFYIDFQKPGSSSSGMISSGHNPDHIGGFKFSRIILEEIDKKLGLRLKNDS